MARKVIWSSNAQNDLRNILLYWTERNKSAAYSIKLYDNIKKSLNIILQFPEIGRKTDFENVRGYVKDNFTIHYRYNINEIRIDNIWDNRRNPDEVNL